MTRDMVRKAIVDAIMRRHQLTRRGGYWVYQQDQMDYLKECEKLFARVLVDLICGIPVDRDSVMKEIETLHYIYNQHLTEDDYAGVA